MSTNKPFIPIQISPLAIKKIKTILEEKEIEADYGLRVGVRTSLGCSTGGMEYLLGFDKKKEGDDEYLINGINIYLEKKHAMYVVSKKIDYIETEEEVGFVFSDTKI